MSESNSTRRDFLRQAGVVGGLSLLGGPGVSGSQAADARVRVRRDIATLAPDGPEIASLRRGFQVMRSRPISDPTSFLFQANIHLTYDKPARPGWNQCPHGSYYWLSWHRMYIYWYERILRAAAGDPSLTLPYWNYANPTARALPIVFRQPADAANSLFVRERNRDGGGINSGAELPASAVAALWPSFSLRNFFGPAGSSLAFCGQVTPKPNALNAPQGEFETYHTLVHILVGGDGGWMSDLFMSGRDPIFFVHHANIDRLWKRWLDQGDGRQNPVNDKVWMDTRFPFVDENGQRVELTARDSLYTEAQLGYRYDDDPPEVPRRFRVTAAAKPPPACYDVIASSAGSPVSLGTEPIRLTIDLNAEARRQIEQALAASSETLVLLNIEDVTYVKEPSVYYEIYLNLPADVKEPDYQSIFFVGNLCFPALVPHHHQDKKDVPVVPGGTRTLPINDIVQELKSRKHWNDHQATVTLVLRSVVPVKGKNATAKPAADARLGRASLAIM